MYLSFFYSPDAAAGGNVPNESAAAPSHTPVRHISSVPSKDADLKDVTGAAAAKWAAESWFIIKYKTQPDFAADTKRYGELLQQRTTAGSGTHGLSTDMHELDVEADDAIPYVKNLWFNIYGPKLAADHYGELGLEHKHNRYELPDDRNKRTLAIKTMIDALKKNKLDGGNYGADWWTEYLTRYNTALDASEGSAKGISGQVGELNQLRTSLRRTLQSMLYILEGNYPDTFEQERRVWGFLKDRY